MQVIAMADGMLSPMNEASRKDWLCMERLKDGDDLALNDIMARWKKPLVSFCLRYTGNLTDALEIAQETFVRVYNSRKRYRPTAAYSTWIFAIATNLCRMRARWRSRHPEVFDAERETDAAALDDSYDIEMTVPSGEADRKALARDLETAVESLPHDLRAAFILYEIQGYPYREVAGIVGCSEKAVERRLARAREKLRLILEPKWAD